MGEILNTIDVLHVVLYMGCHYIVNLSLNHQSSVRTVSAIIHWELCIFTSFLNFHIEAESIYVLEEWDWIMEYFWTRTSFQRKNITWISQVIQWKNADICKTCNKTLT